MTQNSTAVLSVLGQATKATRWLLACAPFEVGNNFSGNYFFSYFSSNLQLLSVSFRSRDVNTTLMPLYSSFSMDLLTAPVVQQRVFLAKNCLDLPLELKYYGYKAISIESLQTMLEWVTNVDSQFSENSYKPALLHELAWAWRLDRPLSNPSSKHAYQQPFLLLEGI